MKSLLKKFLRSVRGVVLMDRMRSSQISGDFGIDPIQEFVEHRLAA